MRGISPNQEEFDGDSDLLNLLSRIQIWWPGHGYWKKAKKWCINSRLCRRNGILERYRLEPKPVPDTINKPYTLVNLLTIYYCYG